MLAIPSNENKLVEKTNEPVDTTEIQSNLIDMPPAILMDSHDDQNVFDNVRNNIDDGRLTK